MTGGAFKYIDNTTKVNCCFLGLRKNTLIFSSRPKKHENSIAQLYEVYQKNNKKNEWTLQGKLFAIKRIFGN